MPKLVRGLGGIAMATALTAWTAYACVGNDPDIVPREDREGGSGLDVQTPDDGGDGGMTCVADLATDPSHCGRCGHSCLGGACDAGGCTPVVVVDEPSQVPSFAVSGSRVFWSSWLQNYDGGGAPRSELRSCTLPDCAATTRTLAAAGPGPDTYRAIDEVAFGMAADETHVYAPAYYHDKILRCPLDGCDGGTPELFTTTFTAPREIVLDDQTVYWITEGGHNAPCACPKTGCTSERKLIAGSIASADRPSDRISVDDANVYFASRANGPNNPLPQAPGFYSVPKGAADAAPSVLMGGREMPKALAFDNDNYYAAYWGSPDLLDTGKIEKQSRVSALATVIATGLPRPSSIVVDGTTLFFTGYSDGTIRRCSTTNCTNPAVVAEGQEEVYYLRQDAVSVFWNVRFTGRILRLAK